MDKPFDLNGFTLGKPAYIRLADNTEVEATAAPLAAVGGYFGIVMLKRGGVVVDHALFTQEGRLNTGLQMYMKGEKKQGWVNIYPTGNIDRPYICGSLVARTEEELLALRDSARALAHIKIEFEV